MEWDTQKGCGVSILRDFETSTAEQTEQPVLPNTVLSRVVGLETSREFFPLPIL